MAIATEEVANGLLRDTAATQSETRDTLPLLPRRLVGDPGRRMDGERERKTRGEEENAREENAREESTSEESTSEESER